jgi:Uma2 family endonuclease
MNQIARLTLAPMTTAEFLAWPGDGSDRRFQLVDGEVQEMSPANVVHGIVQANLSWLFINMVRVASVPLQVVTEGAIIPGLNADDNVRVPDLVVGPQDNASGDQVVNDPILLVEILSPGNQRQTRDNVRAYATLASVQEIVVVHTTKMLAEIHRRDGAGAWHATPEYGMPGQPFRLDTIGLNCALAEVYARTWLIRAHATSLQG